MDAEIIVLDYFYLCNFENFKMHDRESLFQISFLFQQNFFLYADVLRKLNIYIYIIFIL